MLIDEQKQLDLHQCVPEHSEDLSDIHTSFQMSLQMTARRQRSSFLCEMLTDVKF